MSKDNNPNDERPWSDMDVYCLKVALENGDSLDEAAAFVFRSENVDDVRRKAEELGLRVKRPRKRQSD